jgi:hypothetical protein
MSLLDDKKKEEEEEEKTEAAPSSQFGPIWVPDDLTKMKPSPAQAEQAARGKPTSASHLPGMAPEVQRANYYDHEFRGPPAQDPRVQEHLGIRIP